jgi:hypothetical protein
MTTFSANVEAWRPLCEQLGEGIPIDLMLQWITGESGGNPCSIGSASQCQQAGFPNEVGIFQLGTFSSTSAQIGGVTVGELRAPCSGCSQTQVRALSEDEMEQQVQSGVNFIQESMGNAHTALDDAGITDWGEDTDDFWMLVKMHHSAPAFVARLKEAADAGRAGSFADWFQFFLENPHGFSSSLINKAFNNSITQATGVAGSALGGTGIGGLASFIAPGVLFLGALLLGKYIA